MDTRATNAQTAFAQVKPHMQVLVSPRTAEPGRSIDTDGAEFTHRDGKCSFEVLIDDFDLAADAALVRLARIVHATDLHSDPQGAGLLAIGLGGLDVEPDDHRLLERASFVYDALYAWCTQQVTAGAL